MSPLRRVTHPDVEIPDQTFPSESPPSPQSRPQRTLTGQTERRVLGVESSSRDR